MGDDLLGGEAGGEPAADTAAPADAAAGGDDDSVLLATPAAPPGKRDTTITRADGKTTTPDPTAGTSPKKVDRRPDGARKRSYMSKVTPEMFRNTDRTRVPGKQELDRLTKGIYENVDSTYDIEEKKLIESHFEIRRLVENWSEMKMLTKTRHNKKRNTAFIYEALVRELTKCIISKDIERKGINSIFSERALC